MKWLERARRGRGVAARALIAMLAFVAALAWPAAAAAHAPLVRALPAPDARLRAPPRELDLWFAEPIDHHLSGVRVEGPAGLVAGTIAFPSSDPREMTVSPLKLPPGRYNVVWRTTSLIDGHVRSGVYTFTVLEPDGTLPPGGPRVVATNAPRPLPGGLDDVGRWLEYLALAALVGAAVYRAIVRRGEIVAAVPWQAIAIVGGAVYAAGAVEQLLSAAVASRGAGAAGEVLLHSSYGAWWTAGLIGVGLLAASVGLGATRGMGAVAAVGGALAAWAVAASSHAAAGPGSAWAELALFAHVAAALAWIGTMLHLVAGLIGAPGYRRLRSEAAATVVTRFSILAAACVAVLVGSGTLNALAEVPSMGALAATSYGRLLVVKLALVLVLLVPAAANALVLRPRPEARSFPGRTRTLAWSTGAELLAAVAVLAATSVLSQRTPARTDLQVRALASGKGEENPAAQVSSSAELGGRIATLTVTPGSPGLDQVELLVPGMEQPHAVTVRFAGPPGSVASQVTLHPAPPDEGGAVFRGAARLSGPAGSWMAIVIGSGEAAARFTLPLQPAGAPSRASGAWSSPVAQLPGEVPIAIALATVGAVLLLVAARRAQPWRRPNVYGLAVGGVVTLAAVAVGAAGVAGAVSTPASGAASWGRVTPAQAERAGSTTEYPAPSRRSGLMMPAVGLDGRVWVTEMDANAIAVLDPAAGTFRELVLPQPLRGLMGVAVDPRIGRVWLAEEYTNQIGLLDPETGDLRQFTVPTPRGAPAGLAVDGQGRVWFTEIDAGKIGLLDPASGSFRELRIPTPQAVPYWLAVAPDGRVWFTEMNGRAMGVVDPKTGTVREYRAAVTEGEPAGVAVAPDGTVWFATLSGTLGRLDPRTGAMGAVALPPGSSAYGVAVDHQGRVWVGRSSGSALAAYDPRTGKVQPVTLPTRDAGPWWPTVDTSGRVWVVEGSLGANRLALLGAGTAAP